MAAGVLLCMTHAKSLSRSLSRSLVKLIASAVPLGGACLVEAPPPPFGDVAFDWSFAGEPDCAAAGVDFVDVNVFQGGQTYRLVEGEPCHGGGLVLTDLDAGFTYEIQVQAFGRDAAFLYEGSLTVFVTGGRLNNAGILELDALGSPPVRTGDVELLWRFLYPTDVNPVVSCGYAGVDDVDVFVTPRDPSATGFAQTLPCTDEGVAVRNLDAGRYDVELIGYGTYSGDAVQLYDSGVITFDVEADRTTALGDVDLNRTEGAFGDFDLAWGFVGTTCAMAGVATIDFTLTRATQSTPEDGFAVDCTAASVMRRTFVPGSYAVLATAHGTHADWIAQTEVSLAPGGTAQLDLIFAEAL